MELDQLFVPVSSLLSHAIRSTQWYSSSDLTLKKQIRVFPRISDFYFTILCWINTHGYINSLILLYRKIFWKIPAVGNVYSWKEVRFRCATVIPLTSSSTGASADLLVYPRWPFGTFLILGSKEAIQHWSSGTLCCGGWGIWPHRVDRKKMEVKLNHCPSAGNAWISCFKF